MQKADDVGLEAPVSHANASESTPGRVPAPWAWAAGLVPLALGLAAVVQARGLSLGELGEPGPGMWPLVIGMGLCLCSVVLMLSRNNAIGCERMSPGGLGPAAFGIAAGAGFIVAFSTVGVEVAGLLVLTCWLRMLAGRSWRFSITLSICCTVVVFLVFDIGLNVPLPSPL